MIRIVIDSYAASADSGAPAVIGGAPGQPRAIRSRPLRVLLAFLLLASGLMLVLTGKSFAQQVKPSPPTSATSKRLAVTAPAKPVISRPVWAELTVQQQQALRPLAPNWDTISDAQKRKWLEVSKNYSSLPPEGQLTMHSRMTGWVSLSPQQRAQARLNFAKTKELSKELTPDEKEAKWQSYQALSAEEKQKLAARATPKPTGAATAVRPVAPQKLAAIPPASAPRDARTAPKPAALQPVQVGDSALFPEALGLPVTAEPTR